METNVQKNQPIVFKQLQLSIAKNRLAHAYLFEGEKGTGKFEMAMWLTKSIFCLEPKDKPCGECINCERITHKEHPDVIQIEPDGQRIKVEQIREIKETFMKSGMESKQKVLIVQAAEKMTTSAANSLLKFIEEPEGQIIILFLTEAKGQILPTIQSRCQILHFLPLSEAALLTSLEKAGIAKSDGKWLVQLTNSHEKAIELSQNQWFNEAREAVEKWFSYVMKKDSFSFVFVQQRLTKVFKEKEQQGLFFELVLIQFRGFLAQSIDGTLATSLARIWTTKKLLASIQDVLESKRKMEANVSFQNVSEQLALHLLK